jgi:hypothetical protein
MPKFKVGDHVEGIGLSEWSLSWSDDDLPL